jgi:D-cysteine desulfhydrase
VAPGSDDRPIDAPIFRRFPGLRLPYLPLGHGPTPVARLELGPLGHGQEAWWKNDGVYASPYGGNKARKLEWILPDVAARGPRTIVTLGGAGTHHGLATAIYAARAGLDTAIMLVDQPVSAHVREQLARLDASHARLYHTRSPLGTALAAPFVLLRHVRWAGGPRLPYFLQVGGSSPVGTLGYVQAGLELGEQVARGELPAPARVVVALGSGGTAAGLLLGLRLAGLDARVHAVAVTELWPIGAPLVARLANRTARLLEKHGAEVGGLRFGPEDVDVDTGYIGGGYGHALPAAEAARERFIAATGTSMESVYTAKALAGLIERSYRPLTGPVLYWHTYNAQELEPS